MNNFLQKISVINGTLLKTDDQTKIVDSGALGRLPNGDFKCYIGWFDDKDEKIASITYTARNRFYMNSFNGNDFR